MKGNNEIKTQPTQNTDVNIVLFLHPNTEGKKYTERYDKT